jgi:hypothetical protein
MTARTIMPKLRCVLLGLAALAWMPYARAVPEDQEARAPRWATTIWRAPSRARRCQVAATNVRRRMASGDELVTDMSSEPLRLPLQRSLHPHRLRRERDLRRKRRRRCQRSGEGR